MKDMVGHDLQVGDKVVICHSGGGNSTLVTGEVSKINAKSVTVSVEDPGAYHYRSVIVEGQDKLVTVPHRIFCYKPVLPPTTMAQVVASKALMHELVHGSS